MRQLRWYSHTLAELVAAKEEAKAAKALASSIKGYVSLSIWFGERGTLLWSNAGYSYYVIHRSSHMPTMHNHG